METKFPDHDGYEAMFFVGNRKAPAVPTKTERTGTIVLKRTYEIHSVTGSLRPSSKILPVFVQDRPDNVLINGGFDSPVLDPDGNGINWRLEGVNVAQVPVNLAEPEGFQMVHVTGSASGRLVQTVTFDEPLGGREFTLSILAGADANAVIQGVHLFADGVERCRIDANLTPAMTRFQASGIFPSDLEATEMDVVLRMATNSSRTVIYDEVQLEERSYRTRWDANTIARYEHDLAAFKPEGDVVVLGLATAAGAFNVSVDGGTWFTRNLASASPPKKALVGWEPTLLDPRKAEAGTFPAADGVLPANFSNRYFNGHRRDRNDPTPGVDEVIAAAGPFPYLGASPRVTVSRAGPPIYSVQLRGDAASASVYRYSGSGDDTEPNWIPQAIPMRADTVVVEPESHRCYVVWRGVWPFDDHPEDSYRRLVVEASA
jgi:hypothetical protein